MNRRVLAATAALALSAGAGPAAAAATKPATARTLFFGETSDCAAGNYVLDKSAQGHQCGGPHVIVEGNGITAAEQDFSSTRSVTGFKLDTSKHLTGSLYLATYGPLWFQALSDPIMPGQVSATITFSINGTTVGTVSGAGTITPSSGPIMVPVDLRLPSRLNGKTVKRVEAVVDYGDGVAMVPGVAYNGDYLSKFSLWGR